jgi:hypothetical protein
VERNASFQYALNDFGVSNAKSDLQIPIQTWASVDGQVHHLLTPRPRDPKQAAIGSSSSSSTSHDADT